MFQSADVRKGSMGKKPTNKIKTYSAYAVNVPVPFSDEIVRIRPSQEAPEGMAIFDTYQNAQWFIRMVDLPEDRIFPVTIVRSDGRTVVE